LRKRFAFAAGNDEGADGCEAIAWHLVIHAFAHEGDPESILPPVVLTNGFRIAPRASENNK